MASSPTRRKIGAIRRVQSERKGLNFWNKHDLRMQDEMLHPMEQPHMVGISQGIMQSTCLYPTFQPVVLIAPPLLIRSPKEEYTFLAQERLAAFLRSEEPHRPASLLSTSVSDSHVYESLISQVSDFADKEIEKDTKNNKENKYPSETITQLGRDRCATCRKLKSPENNAELKKPCQTAALHKNDKAFPLQSLQSKSTESIFLKPTKHKPYLKAYQKIISLFKRRKPLATEIYQDIQSITSASSFTNFKVAYSSSENTPGSSSSIKPVAIAKSNMSNSSKGLLIPEKKLSVEDKATQVSESELPKFNFSTLDPLRPTDKNNRSYLKHKTRSLVNLTGKDPAAGENVSSDDSGHCEKLPNCDISATPRRRKKKLSWTSACSEDESTHSPEEGWWPWTNNETDPLVLVCQSRLNEYSSPSALNVTIDTVNGANFSKSRQDVSSGLGSSGSDFSSEDGPTTQIKNSKGHKPTTPVGTKGRLKFDYSWSWNNLSNLVRNASLSGYDKSMTLEQCSPQIFV